jgi:low temperature requirement protein LtrA
MRFYLAYMAIGLGCGLLAIIFLGISIVKVDSARFELYSEFIFILINFVVGSYVGLCMLSLYMNIKNEGKNTRRARV